MKYLHVLVMLLIVGFFFTADCFAKPVPPEMALQKSGISIHLSWTSVAGADGYRLYYAPYPYTGPDSIRNINVGSQTEVSYTLWEDAAYYVSVTAYDGSGESHHSNAELFLLTSYSESVQGAPVLFHTTDALKLSLSWTEIPGTNNYRLYYAPYPFTRRSHISGLDMGLQTEYNVSLSEGAAYYVAVTAEGASGESGYSNIELFLLGSPIPEWQNDGAGELDQDGDGYTTIQGDCDDNDAGAYPGAAEICFDGIDNNCSGYVDEPFTCVVADSDFDGDGYTVAQGDCNDYVAAFNPAAVEVCGDGLDQDCSGADLICPGDTDADGDGYSVNQNDCNDADRTVYPGATELCGDGIDQDCSGADLICPSDIDGDGDGYSVNQNDCNDADQTVYPGANEICGDDVDQDCSGADLICPSDADGDGDGYSVNQNDCNDSDQSVFPGATETCGDGIDQDCNGSDLICSQEWYLDNDTDGYATGAAQSAVQRPGPEYYSADELTAVSGDCDDGDSSVNPGAEEVCGDAIDQDCVDGDLLCPVEEEVIWYLDADGDNYSNGTSMNAASQPSEDYYTAEDLVAVSGDCNDNNATIHFGTWETCGDGIDQNCNSSDLACPTGENSFETDLRALIDQYRGNNSLDPLTQSQGLQGFALEHNDYMIQTGDFSHAGFIEIRAPKSFAISCNYTVENLAWNFPTAQSAFDGWKNSAGHNANMLDPDINYIGISKSGAYITMLGCRIP